MTLELEHFGWPDIYLVRDSETEQEWMVVANGSDGGGLTSQRIK